ncbi:hypothetical protein GCM10023100_18690 [Actinocorallia cavernae]|uniref:Uncharacterized protein n=4 Tax=Actinomycetes TaxID=1760 RepID=A0ABP8SH22_9ACTN
MSSPSGRFKPISEPHAMSLLPHRVWSEEDWKRIQLGYFAADMDEKWSVFAEGEVVFLHRSWTGRGIFAATFAPADGGGRRIVEAVVERDPRRYRGQDEEYDCLMLELVLSAIVLGEPARELRAALVESTRRKQGNAAAPAGVVLHSTLGLRSEP